MSVKLNNEEVVPFESMMSWVDELSILKNASNFDMYIHESKEAQEFRQMVAENPILEGLETEIETVGCIHQIINRAWLLKYKGMSYVMFDNGNGHFSYGCQAEEVVMYLSNLFNK